MKRLFIILLMVFSCSSQPKVKVGQIWEYQCNDPFDRFTKTMLIIDIREGYAQYLCKWSTLSGVYIRSDEKAYFNYKTYLRKAIHEDSVMFNLIPKVCEKHIPKGIYSFSISDTIDNHHNTYNKKYKAVTKWLKENKEHVWYFGADKPNTSKLSVVDNLSRDKGDTLRIDFRTSSDPVLARYTEGDSLLWIKLYNGSEMTLKREKTGFRIIKLKAKDGDSLGIE